MATPSSNRMRPSPTVAAVLETATALAGAFDLDGVVRVMAEQARKLLPIAGWRLFLSDVGGKVRLYACYSNCRGKPRGPRQARTAPDLHDGQEAPFCEWCRSHRQLPDINGEVAREGKSLLVPLEAEGERLGILQLWGNLHPGRIAPEEQDLLRGLARQIGIVLKRVRAMERLQGRLATMTAIQEIARAVAGGIELRSLAEMIARHACQLLSADACHVLLMEEKSPRFSIIASSGKADERAQALLAEFTAPETASDKPHAHPTDGIQDEAVLVVPISTREEVMGLIIAQRFDRRHFGEEAVGLLSLFASHASLVIERTRLQAKLLNEAVLRGAMEKADDLKSDFIATVSHELRTPLTAIKGYIDLLLSGDVGDLSEDQKRFLETVQRNTDRLTSRIADLLDISRIEARQLSLDVRPVKFQALAEQAVATLARYTGDRQVDLVLDIPSDLPDVSADPKSILQILTNLLSNAAKYSDAGSRVELRAREYGEQVVVAVIDRGVGIPEEQHPFLFEKFYRVDCEATRQTHGAGLGLSITKSLIELQGGKIWVESAPGKGSRFYFSLPKAGSGSPAAGQEQQTT